MEITKELLQELYIVKGMSIMKIANHLGIGMKMVWRRLNKFNIPRRPFQDYTRKPRLGAKLSEETKKKISQSHLGKRMPEEVKAKLRTGKGWYKDSSGYIWVRKIEHPRAYKHGGYVKRANVVLEEKIGRYLENKEMAHHINHVRDDDNPDNLMLITVNSHNSLTAKERWQSGELREVLFGKKGE